MTELIRYELAGRQVEDAYWNYQWDGANRLTKMTAKLTVQPGSTEILHFTSDAQGRRTVKEHVVTKGEARVVTKRTLLWAGWLPLCEVLEKTGEPITRRWFQWGPDLSGTLDGAAGIGGLVAIHEEDRFGVWKRTLLPITDGIGNITAVLDAADGRVVAQYEFGPFGEPISETGEADACPFRWQSKYYDRETQLYCFPKRYYDPRTGRWLSRDPLGEVGGFNLYAYCGNDPVNRHDPLGAAGKKRTEWEKAKRARSKIAGSYFQQMYEAGVPNGPGSPWAEAQAILFAFQDDDSESRADFWIIEEHIRRGKKAKILREASSAATAVVEGMVSLNPLTAPVNGGHTIVTGTNAWGEETSRWNGVLDLAPGAFQAGKYAKGFVRLSGDSAPTLQAAGAYKFVPDANLPTSSNLQPARSTFRAGAGDKYATTLLHGGTGRALAGHGELRMGAGKVLVPEGTSITFFTPPGSTIRDDLGRAIERGDWSAIMKNPEWEYQTRGAITYLPGSEVDNITLKAPDGLIIHANSRTVEDRVTLSDLMFPDMGPLDWAACLEDVFAP
jgi:RHS repeat-associated protein